MFHPHSARLPHDHPGGRAYEKKYLPRLIAWEVTRRCLLNCVHCRAAARYGPYEDELTTGECYRFLDDVKSFSNPIIILTGGEPMMRSDIYDIASYGTKLGLRMVMAPCGLLVTEELAQKIKNSGIMRVSLSIDGLTAAQHNAFRRVEGAFEGVMKAIENFKKVGMEFQVNTTITKHNVKDLPQLLEMVINLGAVAYHPFLFVRTGRGKELEDQEILPAEYESTLKWFYEMRDKVLIQFKPTCAPHYYRIFRQGEKEKGKTVTPESHGLDAMTKGCMGGQSFAFVSHVGRVQICGFLEEEAGDIKKELFSKIWDTSQLFKEMRDLDRYHGKCGICEYRKVCGGCRARAFAVSGDYFAAEPFCTYEPARMK